MGWSSILTVSSSAHTQDYLESRLREFVSANYLVQHCDLHLFSDGIASYNYRASAESLDIVVRCDLRRNLEAVIIDLGFIEAAKNAGANPPPGPWKHDEIGGIAFLSRPTIVGNTLEDCPGRKQIMLMKSCGKQLATIHQAAAALKRPCFYRFVYREDAKRWDYILKHSVRHPDPELSELAEYLITSLRKSFADISCFNTDNYSLIHGDFKLSNILISPSGRLTVIDWEKACIGPRLFDLALGLFHLIFGTNKPFDLALKNAGRFLLGYRTIITLSTFESHFLPLAVEIAGTAFYLLDIAFAADNRTGPPTHYSQRREDYFKSYCTPTFQSYWLKKTEFSKRFVTICRDI